MERDSFVFYKSWEDAIEQLPEAEQARAYRNIIRYACTGEKPETGGLAGIVYTMAKPIIDANNKRFSDGIKGGRPKTTGFENKKPLVTESKTTGYENSKHNENENENENENVSENENNTEKENEKYIGEAVSSPDPIRYQYIIDNLNGKTGRNYRVTDKTRKLIKARINEGFTEEDFLKVIDNKARDWLNDQKMSQYLRPETLFGTKFEGYLQETHRAYVSGDLPF